MEDPSLQDMIKMLDDLCESLGIKAFQIEGLSAQGPNNIIVLLNDINDNEIKNEVDVYSELKRIEALIERLGLKVLFYQTETNEYNGMEGYSITLFGFHEGIVYAEHITSNTYNENERAEDNEARQKLQKVREAIDTIFKSENYDAEKIVDNHVIPYLEINQIDYLNEFFDVNTVLEAWLEETSGLKDFAFLIKELADYYNDEENGDMDDRHFRIMDKLDQLIPNMYDETQIKEKAQMRQKLNDLSIAIYKKTREKAMMKADAKYVKEIANSFLEYREQLGIKNQKCTKEEIDAFLRMTYYDTRIPKELLKNAMYEVVNQK